MREQLEIYRENVDKKLLIRQLIFVGIIFVLIIITTLNIIEKRIGPLLALFGLILSTSVGVLLSRMFKIFWHQKKEKVMYQLDTLGTTLLIIYIIVEINRKWFFEHWLSGATLSAFSLIILMGLLLGRFIGTFLKINKILEENTDSDISL